MYILKQISEDFIVREISLIKPGKVGSHAYFRLSKRNYNTLDAISAVGRVIGVDKNEIGFAGSKDRNAVTEQVCSMKAKYAPRLAGVALMGITIQILGYGHDPVTLGDLEGNDFEIVVRKIGEEGVVSRSVMVNYFDEQRFSESNVKVGKLLVRKDFVGAARLLDDGRCRTYLGEYPTDGVGALRLVPKRLLRLYVNAFQSALWNQAVGRFIQEGRVVERVESYSQGTLLFFNDVSDLMDLRLPLPGFTWDSTDMPAKYKLMMEDLLLEQGITAADFVIKAIPEISAEGEFRSVITPILDLHIGQFQADELNMGFKKVTLSFRLGKGSYATMAIRQMVG